MSSWNEASKEALINEIEEKIKYKNHNQKNNNFYSLQVYN